MEYISEISSKICFDWCCSQVSKCARCLGMHHVLLLPHFNLLLCCWAPWAPFGVISTFPESSQLELSNDPRCNPKDTLVVPLCAELWCCALSCSFCLWFRICSTSWADLGRFLLRNIQYIYNTKLNICIMSWLWQHHWQSHSGITQSTQVTKIKPRDQLPLWVSEHYLNWSRAKVYFPDVPCPCIPAFLHSCVLTFLCPHIPMSSYSQVLTFPSPHIPASPHPHIPASPHPHISVSPCPHIPMSWHSSVNMRNIP